jgi:hypothetical protein
MSRARHKALAQCSPNFTLPTTLAKLYSLKHAINKEIKMLENNDNLSRAAEQAETREARLEAGDLAGAKALRNIIIAEETREMWRQTRSMEDEHDQGVTSVQRPADRDLTNPNCKTCETWITLDQPRSYPRSTYSAEQTPFWPGTRNLPDKSPILRENHMGSRHSIL